MVSVSRSQSLLIEVFIPSAVAAKCAWCGRRSQSLLIEVFIPSFKRYGYEAAVDGRNPFSSRSSFLPSMTRGFSGGSWSQSLLIEVFIPSGRPFYSLVLETGSQSLLIEVFIPSEAKVKVKNILTGRNPFSSRSSFLHRQSLNVFANAMSQSLLIEVFIPSRASSSCFASTQVAIPSHRGLHSFLTHDEVSSARQVAIPSHRGLHSFIPLVIDTAQGYLSQSLLIEVFIPSNL